MVRPADGLPLEFHGALISDAWGAAREIIKPKVTQAPYPEYYDDPNGFMRDVLGYSPWTAQEAIESGRSGDTGQDQWGDALVETGRVSVVACNGAGKTYYAAALVIWFMCTRVNATVVTTAPTGKQVRKFIWRYLRGLYGAAIKELPGPDPLTQQWHISGTWAADGFATDEETSVQGYHAYTEPDGTERELLAILDEAGGLKRFLYNGMSGWLTKGKCYVFQIGNANVAEGGFYESQQPESVYTRFKCTAHDCPKWMVTDDWIEEMKVTHGEESPLYQIRVLAEFTEAGGQYQWFPAILLRKALEPSQPITDKWGTIPTHIGVDIGDGQDPSVATVTQGSYLLPDEPDKVIDPSRLDVRWEVKAQEMWSTHDTMESVENIITLAHLWKIPPEYGHHIHIDGIGVGSGVVDRLRQRNWPVEDVDFGGAVLYDYPQYVTDDTKVLNRKAELHQIAQRLMADGLIGIPKEFATLRRQLGWLQWKLHGQTEVKVCQPKEQVRKDYQQSPDHADSFLNSLSRASGGISLSSL